MPEPNISFVVDSALSGAALPAALRKHQPGMSWSQVKQQVRSRRVLVNETVCLDEGRRLSEGEMVRVTSAAQTAPPSREEVLLRHLDRHLVVVEKPSGMRTVAHSSERGHSRRRRDLHPALQDVLPELIARHEQRTGVAKKRGRPAGGSLPAVRLVHRIDRETSGLLVFARSQEAMNGLMKQFKEHSVDRVYFTAAAGRVEAQRFESSLVDDRGDGRRGSSPLKGAGKRAVTHVRPLEFLPQMTLLECRLETGRTHQIRIHLSEAGHPVCGDKRYHQPLFAPAIPDVSGAPRLVLHAQRLGFEHPVSGERMTFEMPLPGDLDRWLKKSRGE